MMLASWSSDSSILSRLSVEIDNVVSKPDRRCVHSAMHGIGGHAATTERMHGRCTPAERFVPEWIAQAGAAETFCRREQALRHAKKKWLPAHAVPQNLRTV